MKNTGIVFLAFATVIFSACMNNTGKTIKVDVTKDTLAYSYKNIEKQGADCKNATDTNCAILKISYPVFVSQNKLNAMVISTLLNLELPGNKGLKDLQTLADGYLFQQEQYYHRFPKAQKVPFSLLLYAKVIRQDSSLVTVQVRGSGFAGQSGSLIQFINYNVSTGKAINLTDIFTDGYNSKLTSITEEIFRKEENLTDTSSLARDYFFKDAKFALNNNFLITPTGIRFVYNEREIKPVQAGTTDLFIPYSQIKTLLKPNTVLTQYIQH